MPEDESQKPPECLEDAFAAFRQAWYASPASVAVGATGGPRRPQLRRPYPASRLHSSKEWNGAPGPSPWR